MSLSKPELLPVFLTPEQAALFVLFQTYYEPIAYMISQGVFDIKRGTASINFDNEGNVSSIKRELYSYPKGKVV